MRQRQHSNEAKAGREEEEKGEGGSKLPGLVNRVVSEPSAARFRTGRRFGKGERGRPLGDGEAQARGHDVDVAVAGQLELEEARRRRWEVRVGAVRVQEGHRHLRRAHLGLSVAVEGEIEAARKRE